MDINRSSQTAGDNAQQIQVGSLTVVQGITEERAREICREMQSQAIMGYTQDAHDLALKRIGILEEHLMRKVDEVEGVLESFSDPAFQILLAEAQKRAAATEREADYKLLSELLVCHVQKGACRVKRAGINRAVEIVGDIDTNALCALTVANAVTSYLPVAGNISEGLQVLNDMFGKLIYERLPSGYSWLDHLDVLGAVRLSSFGNMKKMCEYYSHSLNGYACTGIRKDSDEYKKAIELLSSVNLNVQMLVDNECLDGYVRLNITDKGAINKLVFHAKTGKIPLFANQTEAIMKVWNLYSNDSKLKREAQNRFVAMWDSFATLAELKQWWDDIPGCFHVTQVGKVLAHTNAQRCDSSIPDFI